MRKFFLWKKDFTVLNEFDFHAKLNQE